MSVCLSSVPHTRSQACCKAKPSNLQLITEAAEEAVSITRDMLDGKSCLCKTFLKVVPGDTACCLAPATLHPAIEAFSSLMTWLNCSTSV